MKECKKCDPECGIIKCRECNMEFLTCEGYDGYCPDCTCFCDQCGYEMTPDK